MLASTPRAATPAGAAAATAAGIALLFVGVLAAAPVSGLGPDAAILIATSDDDEGMRGVRRETTPASLARAPRQQREPTPDAHAGYNTRHRTEDGGARSEGRLRESRWGDRGE